MALHRIPLGSNEELWALFGGFGEGFFNWIKMRTIDFGIEFATLLVFFVAYGTIFGLKGSGRTPQDDIQVGEQLAWAWPLAIQGAAWGTVVGFAAVTPFALFMKSFFALIDSSSSWMLGGSFALFAAAGLGVAGFFLGGLRGRRMTAASYPGQGIRLQARNALLSLILISFGFCSGMGLAVWALLHLLESFYYLQVSTAALLGLIGWGYFVSFGVIGALWHGGFSLIQHFTLRFMLYAERLIFWWQNGFLDSARERILLDRVGGSFRFKFHPQLRDYFSRTSPHRGRIVAE